MEDEKHAMIPDYVLKAKKGSWAEKVRNETLREQDPEVDIWIQLAPRLREGVTLLDYLYDRYRYFQEYYGPDKKIGFSFPRELMELALKNIGPEKRPYFREDMGVQIFGCPVRIKEADGT